MSHANLKNASLKGADLSYSILDDADFSGADLTGANLTGASTKDAKLDTARYCRTIMLDGSVKSQCPVGDVPPHPVSPGNQRPVEKARDCPEDKTWHEIEMLAAQKPAV